MNKLTTIKKGEWLMRKVELVLLLFLFLIYFQMAFFGRGSFWESFQSVNLYFILFTFPTVFLLNTYFLIPAFVKHKKWILYFLTLILFQITIEVTRTLLTSSVNATIFGEESTLISFVVAVVASWIFVLTRDWIINVRLIERLKADKLQSELAFLKVQVDPHFLFNTLNNVYALALEENSTKTADAIIKLSSLMRYNLHDSNEEFIGIEKEIDYIEKYIALQMLRLNENNRVDLKVDFEKGNCNSVKIAPLLLIPFIENVFKYGVSPSKPSEISIKIIVTNNTIELITQNDIVEVSSNSTAKGVGLKNVKNRLDLLYTNQYELSYSAAVDKYYSYLKIQLSKR